MIHTFAIVFLFIYLPVIQNEEQHLRKIFPTYEAYANQVPALFPRIGPPLGGQPFRWQLYLKNQEYQAGLGFLIGLAYLLYRQ